MRAVVAAFDQADFCDALMRAFRVDFGVFRRDRLAAAAAAAGAGDGADGTGAAEGVEDKGTDRDSSQLGALGRPSCSGRAVGR